MITNKKLIIKVIIIEILRKDQKYFAPVLKNSGTEKPEASFFKLLNSPPVRKELIINPIISTNINPEVINDIMVLNVEPRSVKTSRLKPSSSLSVIMLVPNAAFNDPLKGITKTETKIRKQNQTIKTPCRDFIEREKPDFKDLNIFILTLITII